MVRAQASYSRAPRSFLQSVFEPLLTAIPIVNFVTTEPPSSLVTLMFAAGMAEAPNIVC